MKRLAARFTARTVAIPRKHLAEEAMANGHRLGAEFFSAERVALARARGETRRAANGALIRY